MAKKLSKSIRLPKGVAKKQYDAFAATPSAKNIPAAICYSLDDIKTFVADSEAMFIKENIPAAERGIAIMPGINLGDQSHTKGKVTYMLIATKFTDDADGKVTAINNCVLGKNTGKAKTKKMLLADGSPTNPGDTSGDNGSLWP